MYFGSRLIDFWPLGISNSKYITVTTELCLRSGKVNKPFNSAMSSACSLVSSWRWTWALLELNRQGSRLVVDQNLLILDFNLAGSICEDDGFLDAIARRLFKVDSIVKVYVEVRDVHGSDRIVGFLGSDRTGSDPIRQIRRSDPKIRNYEWFLWIA